MQKVKDIRSIKGIKSFSRENLLGCLLIFLSIIPLLSLLHLGLPQTHDGQDHVARIANFYQSLSEGVFVPRWAGNLNWGYGHPILMFLYPLPSYTTSLIHFLGFSLVDSVKIFFGLAFVVSGLTMYLWLKEFLSKESAFVGSLLYLFAPYRFLDLHVRGAIGEHAAFIFPPLVLYFLFRLSKNQSYWYFLGGSLSLAGLILAHNAISLMFLPIIFLYTVFLVWQSKKRRFLISYFLFLILFGFLLSTFFWMPALLEGKYTLRDIVTKGEVFNRFVSIDQFIYGPWNYGINVQIGLVHWLFILASVPLLFIMKKKHYKNWILLLVSFIFFLFTLFLMTSNSQFIWERITTLQKFQFPWRFLSLSVFLSAFIGAMVFDHVIKSKVVKSSGIILVIFTCLILFANKDYWQPKAYLTKPEIFYTGIYNGTTDTGESAPIWSVRFMEARPDAHMDVISAPASGKGNVIIKEAKRTSTFHEYSVETSGKTQLRENTLYFPGWKVFVDGVQIPVEYQDAHNRGVMTFKVEKGKHTVMVTFGETKLRLLADWISLAGLLVLAGWGILKAKGIRKI